MTGSGFRIAGVVGVWGTGIEGAAALEALEPSAERIVICDNPLDEAVQLVCAAHSVEAVTPDRAMAEYDLQVIVRSPGVSVHRSDVRQFEALGVRVTTLLELWMSDAPVECIIGVTGTKGKSTTTKLLTELLCGSGLAAESGGNMGMPVTKIGKAKFGVVEVSSYQAAGLRISPRIGVLTNLEIDHIPWHGTIEQYHADKLQLFVNSELQHLCLHPKYLPTVSRLVPALAPKCVSPEDLGYDISNGALRRYGDPILDLRQTSLAPFHMSQNLLVACAAAELATNGAMTAETIVRVVEGFDLPFGRLEVVGSVNQVTWVSDALASNPFAVAAAVDFYSNCDLVLILGGEDRFVDPVPLERSIVKHGRVRAVLLLGTAGEAWFARLKALLDNVVPCKDLRTAVAKSADVLTTSGVVLFSPGAPTSADEGNWETRTNAFINAVQELPRF